MIEYFNTLFKNGKKLWKVSSPNSNQAVAIQTNFVHKKLFGFKNL
jgi:hypothetical protein